MRVLGVLLLLVGLTVGAYALRMDTTLASAGGSRVHNLGLMERRQTILQLGGLGVLIGVLVIGFSRRPGPTQPEPTDREWRAQQQAEFDREQHRGGSSR